MSNWHSCRIKLLQILLLCFIKPWTLYCAMLWLHLIRSTFPFIQLCPFFWERNWQLWHSCTLEEEPFFWTLSNPLPRQRGTQARNPHWTKLHFSRISSAGDDLLTCLHFWPAVQWILHKFWVLQNSVHYTKHKIVYFLLHFWRPFLCFHGVFSETSVLVYD